MSSRVLTAVYIVAGALLLLLSFVFPNAALVIGSWAALGIAVRVLGPSALSPALIVSVGFTVVAVTGWMFYPLVERAPLATGIQLPSSPELMSGGFYGLTLASLGVSAGATLVGLAMRPPKGGTKLRAIQMPASLRLQLVFATAFPAVMSVAMRGLTDILERDEYIPEGSASGFAGLLSIVGTVAMAVCGYLLRTQVGLSRLFVMANVALFTLSLVSSGSRRLAAIPLLLAVGYYMARPDKRARRLLVIGLVVALLIVPLPLYWRTLDTHGIVPYLGSMSAFFEVGLGIDTAAKTILISVPIIGATAQQALPKGALLTALDPRSGEAAGWYELAPVLRLNVYSPMAGVGELLAYGPGVLFTFFLFVGLLLGAMDRHVRRLVARGHQLPAFVHVALAALFLVYIIQYNLRPSVRMLDYSMAFFVAYTVWYSLTRRANQRTPRSIGGRPTSFDFRSG